MALVTMVTNILNFSMSEVHNYANYRLYAAANGLVKSDLINIFIPVLLSLCAQSGKTHPAGIMA